MRTSSGTRFLTRALHGFVGPALTPLIFVAPIWSQGGGVALYETVTPNIGEAYAGQAAIASDASTAFLNPAGMTRLHGTQFLFGGQLEALSVRFSPTSPGSSGGNAGGDFVVPGVYFVQSIKDRLGFGFSFNSPFGLALNYDQGWAGRYFVQTNKLMVLEARTTLAFRANRWLSVGGGPTLDRASVSETSAVPNFDPGYGDGALSVSIRDWGVGWNGGVLIEPTTKTRIGVSYRSKVDFELRGDTTITNVGPSVAALLAGAVTAETPFHLPQGANISLVHQFGDRFSALADTGWTNWRHFGEKSITLPDGQSTTTDAHWRDTWRAGLGMRYRLSRRMTLQAGGSYDSSPVSAWNRTPDLPVARQTRIAGGVQYEAGRSMVLGLSYSYLDFGKPEISYPQNLLAGPLAGRYSQARLPILAVTLAIVPHER